MSNSHGFNDSSRSSMKLRNGRLSNLGFILAISIATIGGIAKAFANVAYNQGQMGLTLIFTTGITVALAALVIVVFRTATVTKRWFIAVFVIAFMWLGGSLGTAIMKFYGDLSISVASQYTGDLLTLIGIVLVIGYLGTFPLVETGSNSTPSTAHAP